MRYNLVFSTDTNYLPYLFVLCQSIVENLSPNDHDFQDELIFNVLIDQSVNLDEVNTKGQSFLERNKAAQVKATFNWHVIDAEQFRDFAKMHKDSIASFSTYYRLMIDRILPKDVKYAAYLDIDMLVLSDIRELFNNHKLEGKVLGAVVDPGVGNCDEDPLPYINVEFKDKSQASIHIPKSTYFNAGLLLINLEEWRDQNIGPKCLELAPKIKPKYHDQDLLNYICLGHVQLLDLSWNYQTPMFFVLYNEATKKYDISSRLTPHILWQTNNIPAEEFERQSRDIHIVHFTTAKPWATGRNICIAPFSKSVPIPPRFEYYRSIWRDYSNSSQDYTPPHTLNSDAVSATTVTCLIINKKRRRDNKHLFGLIAVSIVLSAVSLIVSILS